MIDFDLADFAAAVQERGAGWDAAGIQWQFTLGPARDKSAAWVICETTQALAQLTIWTSGEAELDIGDLTTGATNHVHYNLTTQDLAARLDELTQRLSSPPAA
ncbi:MAG: hypothetical protein ACJ72W_11015 [Actinoallomurus sp.]